MTQIVKKIVAIAGIAALLTLGSVVVSTAPAGAGGGDLCDLLGDPYCPDSPSGGSIECPTVVSPGSTGTCTVTGDVGPITAVLNCGGNETVVFQGEVEDGGTFDFAVPDDVAPGTQCTLSVNGQSFPITAGGVTLARTGSDVGPAVAIGAGLILLGGAAFYASRRRTNVA